MSVCPNVDFVVLAEFDIDQGSMVKHQYPRDSGINTQFLAEMMLPDGVHKWEDDWTTFFLNRGLECERASQKKPSPSASAPTADSAPTPISPPFLAFLYEFEESTGKGWVLQGKKSLSLWPTKIEIREKTAPLSDPPIHTIAKHPDLAYTQLEALFSCVLTETGIALGFRFSQAEEEASFSAHVDNLIKGAAEPPSADPPSPGNDGGNDEDASASAIDDEKDKPLLYCLNRVITIKDDSVRRGAVVRALALCSRHRFVHAFKPLLILGLDDVYKKAPEKQENLVLSALYDSINAIDLSGMPVLTEAERCVRETYLKGDRPREYEAVVNYSGVPMPIKIPLTRMDEELSNYQVIPLIRKFGPGVMAILNAVLMQKRVLFLGYDMQADILCNCVLACYGIVSPPLRGILHRFFPYTNLSSLDFLQIPGYVAGVGNPMFADRTEWWDVLCDVSKGKITFNDETASLFNKLPSAGMDAEFFTRLNDAVSSHFGEEQVRAMMQEYVQDIIDGAFGETEVVEKDRAAVTSANAMRIDAWKISASYEDYKSWRESRTFSVGPLVPQLIRKLRVTKNIEESEMLSIYNTFDEMVRTDDQVMEFLSLLPESKGGLYPIAVSLFHENESIRKTTVELFKRLDPVKSGAGLISSLNFFLYLCYNGQKASSLS